MRSLADLHGWFSIDFVSSVPWGLLIEDVASSAKLLRVGKALKAIKLVRLSKVFKFTQNSVYATHLEELCLNKTVMAVFTMIKFTLGTVFLCHILACFWALVSYSTPEGETSWIMFYSDKNEHGEDTKPLEAWPAHRAYIACIYWTMTTLTTVGYGANARRWRFRVHRRTRDSAKTHALCLAAP